ncbi:hypothetical protein MMC31_004822, partial [Peltigera leucophlebia]|nr:hypothetical protein [Peltigera leucophlebia]
MAAFLPKSGDEDFVEVPSLSEFSTVKESEARVAAAAAAAAAPAGAAPAPRKTIMEGDDIGEVPPEVMNFTLRFAGLPQEEI